MYKIYDSYLLRIPRLPLSFYFDLTNNDCSDDFIFQLFNNDVIKEALLIASPDLYKDLVKVCSNSDIDVKKKEKVRISFLKYLYRISSRTTPFGLFSGVSVGNLINDVSVLHHEINNESFYRHSRLDMQVCSELVNLLVKNESVFFNTIFFSNTSFYRIEDNLRYLEKVFLNGKLNYQIVEVFLDEYLVDIIERSKKGVTINSLIEGIISSGEIEVDEAKTFIDELISSQILINELELTVSGKEPIFNIIEILEKRVPDLKELSYLKSIEVKIRELDNASTSINNFQLYNEVYDEILHLIGAHNMPKNLFQVDLYFHHSKNLFSEKLRKDIYDGLDILKYFFHNKDNSKSLIDEFKTELYKRYENQEVSLMEVLDEEIGIGYPVNAMVSDSNPLLKDLPLGPGSYSTTNSLDWTAMDTMLLKKVIDSKNEKSKYITILESDLKTLPLADKPLCDTFSSMVQIVNIDGEKRIFMPGVMGSSAANLLARFAHGDENISHFLKSIAKSEGDSNPNKITAEIVHMAENKLGNIQMRPSFRDYEIPIATRSEKENDSIVLLEDLFLKLENNRIVLYSKTNSKEILPRLSNAHNYRKSTLPVYKFLCDFQFYDNIRSLGFNWGNLFNELDYFPRVYYKNIILSIAKWKINVDQLKPFIDSLNSNTLLENFNNWRKGKDIPTLFYLSNGDNKLLINSDNKDSVIVFLNEIKKYQIIYIEEFMFGNDSNKKKDDLDDYVNEFIISFYKENILKI